MKKFLLIAFLFIASQEALAAGGAACGDYGECDSFSPELNNLESLQLGALTFINHCYGCHSLKYSRWGRVAQDLEIPEGIFTDNLVFGSNVKLGDRMTGSMNSEVSEAWFGIAPPDLTLVTRLHGSDWVYTYLRTFYEDASKPYGSTIWYTLVQLCPTFLVSCKANKFSHARKYQSLLAMVELEEMRWVMTLRKKNVVISKLLRDQALYLLMSSMRLFSIL